MKRLLNLLLALTLVAALAGCNASFGEKNVSLDEIFINSMYNIETGQTVSLDMTREKIEKKLGKGTEQELMLSEDENFMPLNTDSTNAVVSDTQYISYGTGENFIVVTYQGETPVAISSYGNFSDVKPGPSNWCIKYGLSYGASMVDIVAKYGEAEDYPIAPDEDSAKEGEGFLVTPNASWKNPVWLSYFYDKGYNRLDNLTDENILYQLSLIVDEEQDGLMWYTVSYGINAEEHIL